MDTKKTSKREACEEQILDLLAEFKTKAAAIAEKAGLDFGEDCAIEVVIRKDFLSVWNNYWARPDDKRIHASRCIPREGRETETRHYVA